MKNFRILPVACLALFGAMGAAQAQENEARTLQELLDFVREGSARDNQAEQQRLQQFRQAQAQQQQMLQNAIAQRTSEEQRSEMLETTFEQNELLIQDVQGQLDARLGSLRELFGVLQQVAGDARAQFQNSLTNIEYPDRGQFLTDLAAKMGQSSQLASIEEIERLWFELQRQATEQGKVKRLTNFEVVTTDGEISVEDIVRVGSFNIVADGRYLQHNTETNSVSELQRQPEQGRFVNSTSDLVDADPGEIVRFGLDPTRGVILAAYVDTPNLQERINQGGIVGYVIIALGLLGVLLALERLLMLTIAGRKVKSQLKRDTPSSDNALGRVLQVYQSNKQADTETLELKLGEAILKELPRLQRGILFIKVISVVAPLLGLLGTVTGMIAVFDVMASAGTGNARSMAAGVAQATIPTMAGMVGALSGVFAGIMLSRKADRYVEGLQDSLTMDH